MNTILINQSSLLYDPRKDRDDTTTYSSVTIHHTNVTDLCRMENTKSWLAEFFKKNYSPRSVQTMFDLGTLIQTVRYEVQKDGLDFSALTDDMIIQQARECVNEKPPSDVKADNSSAKSSLTGDSPDGGAAAVKKKDLVPKKTIDEGPETGEQDVSVAASVGSISMALGQVMYEAGAGDGMSSVQNDNPIAVLRAMPNDNVVEVSPPRLVPHERAGFTNSTTNSDSSEMPWVATTTGDQDGDMASADSNEGVLPSSIGTWKDEEM